MIPYSWEKILNLINLKKICDVAISSNFTKGFNNQKDIIKILWMHNELQIEKSIRKNELLPHAGKKYNLGAVIAFYFGEQAYYVYGASSNEFRNYMPNYLLQWEIIQNATKKECKVFDMYGISGDINSNNKY